MANLSKNWTVGRANGILRQLTKTLTTDKITFDTLNDVLYGAVTSVVEMLGQVGYRDYGAVSTITLTANQFDLSTLSFDDLIKVHDATNGLCAEVPLKQLDDYHTDIEQNASNVAFSRHGDTLIFNPGALTVGVLKLYYIRTPTKTTATTDKVDIKEKYMDLVVDKAKIRLYEMTNKVPPESLTSSVANSIERIRNANAAELKAIQSDK